MKTSWIVLPLLALVCSCTSGAEPAMKSAASRHSAVVSADQCAENAGTNGKVNICHATNSEKNPYVDINVDVAGCVNGHAKHARDFFFTPAEAGRCLQMFSFCCPAEHGSCCDGLTCQVTNSLGDPVYICAPPSSLPL